MTVIGIIVKEIQNAIKVLCIFLLINNAKYYVLIVKKDNTIIYIIWLIIINYLRATTTFIYKVYTRKKKQIDILIRKCINTKTWRVYFTHLWKNPILWHLQFTPHKLQRQEPPWQHFSGLWSQCPPLGTQNLERYFLVAAFLILSRKKKPLKI